jgi:hypothetical protein
MMVATACASAPPPTKPVVVKKSGPPLSATEMQSIITGAARLNRHCLAKGTQRTPAGLYVIRLIVGPSGRVQSATPMRAPSRASDPARYSGTPTYIDAGQPITNDVTRCYARAFAQLRFRRFSGPPVGFDHPVVVDRR